jgi:Domain of unknown function (DUF1854)
MSFSLTQDSFGNLEITLPDGQVFQHVKVVRAFPITNPDHGFSIIDQDGKELVWFEALSELNSSEQEIVRHALEQVEFIPVIQRITNLNTYALPSIWEIETDRGNTQLKLKNEQDIRRVSSEALLITDANGIQYLIKNRKTIDKFSKKVLDRFM